MISFSFLIFIDDNLPGFGLLTSKVSKKNKLKQKTKKEMKTKSKQEQNAVVPLMASIFLINTFLNSMFSQNKHA